MTVVFRAESPWMEYSISLMLMACAGRKSPTWTRRAAGLVRVQLKDYGFDDQPKGMLKAILFVRVAFNE